MNIIMKESNTGTVKLYMELHHICYKGMVEFILIIACILKLIIIIILYNFFKLLTTNMQHIHAENTINMQLIR